MWNVAKILILWRRTYGRTQEKLNLEKVKTPHDDVEIVDDGITNEDEEKF